MITPQSLINNILDCFETKKPDTVILGGSYATNENAIITHDRKIFLLSDFDLLCISDEAYTNSEKIKIYENMLKFSQNLNQANPYFHIGLKIRGKNELKNEIDSLYFKELSIIGKTLIGDDFLSFFNEKAKFSFTDSSNKSFLYQKLLKSAMMRIWCNILFFPIKLLNTSEVYEPLNLWYSYFISRGMMDWLTFELIENNIWKDTYSRRFEEYKKVCQQKYILNLMKTAIDIKLGKNIIDWKTIFEPIISFSLNRLTNYCQKANTFENNYELNFLSNMSEYVVSYMSNQKNKENILLMAKKYLEIFIKKNIDVLDKQWLLWHRLRCEYSNHKFSLNEKYKMDHFVYTNYFLHIGCLL